MMAIVEWLEGQYALAGSDDELAIECPECHLHYVPVTREGMTELKRGRMYAVRCPRCTHGVYFNQLAEGIDWTPPEAA